MLTARQTSRYQRLVAMLALLTMCSAWLPLTARPAAVSAEAASDITLVPYIAGLEQPVAISPWPGNPGHLLVVERGGTIRHTIDGTLDATPWLDIRDRVNASEGEQGLLGMAVQPNFPSSGALFVMYTAADGANTVSRFSANTMTGEPDPASEVILISMPDRASNHNGGMLAFGPDGYLYIGTGDEGGGGDLFGNAQRVDRLFGKLLRIDVAPSATTPYQIPPGNLVDTNPNAAPEVWALGLRNPWRFSFDRDTGDLWLADVGQETWEEINFLPAGTPGGTNFGWNVTEGNDCYGNQTCDASDFHLPIMTYSHDDGCSVTGGYRYRGWQYPDAIGAYVFGDFCSGNLWMAREADGRWQSGTPLDTGRNISAFGEDANGELYVADLNLGTVYRLQFGGAPAPAGAEREATWERTDALVEDGVVNRTWIWGPALTWEVFEPYAESQGGERSVQYFDKARMEITHALGDPTSIWYVTNGLLVVELMSGNMQLGDDLFEPYAPARVPVVGDLNDTSGPTYATLAELRDAPAALPGDAIDMRVDRDGNVTEDRALAERGAVAAERVTLPGIDHTVADVFWAFMNSSGTVEVNGQIITDRLFVDPFYATGLPITEAYWTTAAVGGTPRDVLLQCFERRCLTWTPDNPDGWQVEAANVGLHYLTWRTGVLNAADKSVVGP